jgi:AcrR family transcriptional regulator
MTRETYHHGDLAKAAVAEAVVLARTGGPDAVVLREVARRVQVSPAAIYRHYPDREALLGEVAAVARRDLAGRILQEASRVAEAEPRRRAVARFLALGLGYIAFAHDEPNLLEVAFLPIAPKNVIEDPNLWLVLASALDELAATGAMPPERRAGAEVIAWSAVHGFATLRAGRAFESSGEPDPDPVMLVESIARSLEIREI